MRWIAGWLPTRERILANRWIRPFADRLGHPLLWHFNRRSIARGVALGLFAGFLIPLGQTPIAALFALTARANLLIAACATLVTNPLTFPPIYFGAYKLGHRLTGGGSGEGWISRMGDVAVSTALGLLLFAITASAAGYCVVHLGWRWRIARRWQQRVERRRRRRTARLFKSA